MSASTMVELLARGSEIHCVFEIMNCILLPDSVLGSGGRWSGDIACRNLRVSQVIRPKHFLRDAIRNESHFSCFGHVHANFRPNHTNGMMSDDCIVMHSNGLIESLKHVDCSKVSLISIRILYISLSTKMVLLASYE